MVNRWYHRRVGVSTCRLALDEYDALLAPKGRFVMTGSSGGLNGQVMLQGKRRAKQTGQPPIFVQMQPKTTELAAILGLMQEGQTPPRSSIVDSASTT